MLSGVALVVVIMSILWTKVITILFNLEDVLFFAAAEAAADSGGTIPVGAEILWSTATADMLKIRDYCSGIHGAVTFQDINKSIPTISARVASRGPCKGLRRALRAGWRQATVRWWLWHAYARGQWAAVVITLTSQADGMATAASSSPASSVCLPECNYTNAHALKRACTPLMTHACHCD